MSLQERVTREFERRFDGAPTVIVRAPGRVNLIGEHTDYNDGFVLPMAIDRAMWIALRPRADQYVLVYSLDFDDLAEFSLTEMVQRHNPWAEYIKGVAWSLGEAGFDLRGWDGVIAGDVPIGAGLSSSAAVEMATARAFAQTSGLEWDAPQMARLGQRAENEWVGVKCGIMDQMISAAGVAGHALLIDCRTLELQPAPLPSGTSVVILDTATRRELATSAYNERREQCELAARFFGVPALRDVTLAQFEALGYGLDPLTAKRARHVITENERTLAAAQAMQAGDAAALGRLMDASHISMRDDFEISRAEMDAMVALAQVHPASFGARMTGGGFGGCAVALVRSDAAQRFADEVSAQYRKATGLTPAIYITDPQDGASVVQG